MIAPQEEFYPEPHAEPMMFMFRIISRKQWDELQGLHKACPGSSLEHLMTGTGLYVLTIPPGGARKPAA